MKNILYILFYFAVFLSGLWSLNAKQLVKINLRADSSYLYIPISDNSPKVEFSILDEIGIHSTISTIRIANDSSFTWVTYPISQYRGTNIEIQIDCEDVPVFGLKKIYQSNNRLTPSLDPLRPNFHFSPKVGWMNDPNGMVYLDGEFHLFYQYNPYGNKWGNMHWGHSVSKDLISWEELDIAIFPDTTGDVFSGSALIDKNNTAGFGKNAMVAIYTSNGKSQTQSLAYSTDNGRTFTKYKNNPIIPNPGIPDFRDPKVRWEETFNKWIMTLATGQTVTFYESKDLKSWTKLSEFGEGIGCHNGVWECPDLFPMDYNGEAKWILLSSINPGGPNGGSATQYFIGSFDGIKFKADSIAYPLWLDYGRDNYAGITWNNLPQDDNRKLFVGWMSNWDYAEDVPANAFRSSMTLARELVLKNNGKHLFLASTPVSEILSYTKSYKNYDSMIVDSSNVQNIPIDSLSSYSIEMEIEPGVTKNIGLCLKNELNERITYTFDLKKEIISFERKNSGLTNFNSRFSSGSVAALPVRSSYKLRLFIDTNSSELFLEDGEIVITNLFFSNKPMNQIEFSSTDKNYEIKNIRINKINEN